MNIRQQKNIDRFTNVHIRSGFTLVETLVAISILLIAVVGPMSAISKSLMQMTIARDQMIAINLAQEGIEAVRQKRDSNVLEVIAGVPGASWMSGLNQPRYKVDLGAVIFCGASCSPLMIDAGTGLYGQALGAVSTPFSREISITGGGTIERKITSTVGWTRGGVLRKVVVSEAIFNWTN